MGVRLSSASRWPGNSWVTRFGRSKQNLPFEIPAIVLLPDHLHAMWSLPPGDDEYPVRYGGASRKNSRKAILRTAGPKVRFRSLEKRVESEGFGSPAIRGSMSSVTRPISIATSITFITIRSSTVMQRRLPVGRIPRFTAGSGSGCMISDGAPRKAGGSISLILTRPQWSRVQVRALFGDDTLKCARRTRVRNCRPPFRGGPSARKPLDTPLRNSHHGFHTIRPPHRLLCVT